MAPQVSLVRAAQEEPWFKDPEPFIQHPTNLETRLELLQHSFITPNSLFFVRNNAPSTPHIDVENYRLVVAGDAVEREIELTYDDLRRLPSRSIPANVECAGNWRGFYDVIQDRPASGGQWRAGAIGLAYWTGTPLREVLNLAGVREDAVDVQLIGLDEEAPEEGFRRPMSIEKALDPNTLLAYTMNGDELPRDHGFPIRAVLPGWVGSNSIKWLGRIVVSPERVWSRNTVTSYVLAQDPDEPRPEWDPPEGAPEQSRGAPVWDQSIKSALALPWPAQLESGRQVIRGFASPALHNWDETPTATVKESQEIAMVEWRVDDGPWHRADLLDPLIPGVWTRFEFEWDATPGQHTISTRATDAQGLTQPDVAPWNESGFLMNQVLPHPVEVA